MGIRAKPQGVSGAISVGASGAVFNPVRLPPGKAEREDLIARLFVEAFDRWVATESTPSLKPFTDLKQNQENDLDFTVTTSLGAMLMELVEFAPLETYGPRFENAPSSVHPARKAALAFEAITRKSDHQGGSNRILVAYCTEHAFWLDPITIERARRLLAATPPRFDRVYYVSVHNLTSASVSEIFPGAPHHQLGELSDHRLDGIGVHLPHPKHMVESHHAGAELRLRIGVRGGSRLPVRLELLASTYMSTRAALLARRARVQPR